jgi:hypothetical protein
MICSCCSVFYIYALGFSSLIIFYVFFVSRMRNHELVPVELIGNIAHLKHGGLHKVLSTLLRHKVWDHPDTILSI